MTLVFAIDDRALGQHQGLDTASTSPHAFNMERLTINDTQSEAVMKLAENNPGAVTAMMGLMEHAEHRGQNTMSPLLQLDRARVYGSSIWMLHKDVCRESPEKVYNVLDAWKRDEFQTKSCTTPSKAVDRECLPSPRMANQRVRSILKYNSPLPPGLQPVA